MAVSEACFEKEDLRILVFAKAPRLGRVKTRLVPPLTPRAAAALHRELLEGTLARLAAARIAPIELWCAPDPAHPPFPSLAARYGVTLHRQVNGDLGERMLQAAVETLRHSARIVLVGTDCPVMDAGYVRAASEALQQRDAVLGPAEDGGYVLLGLRRAAPVLFADIPWGTGRVAELTRARLRALGWDWAELATLWDLDRPEDLLRYSWFVNGAG